jgi:primosomal protein N' (replication factor Y) (superfamily II helicase)
VDNRSARPTSARPILRVAVDTPLRRAFDYLAPAGFEPSSLVPGRRVRIPFGRRRLTGLLLEVTERSGVPPHKLKPALEIIDSEPVFDAAMFGFLEWAADYYHHPIGEVISAALPVLLRLGRPLEEIEERWQLSEGGRQGVTQLGARATKQRALLDKLAAGPLSAAELTDDNPRWRDTLRELARKGWVESVSGPLEPSQSQAWTSRPGPALTHAQSQVVADVLRAGERFGAWLLDGVTGSGKTEVYLRVVAEVLVRGQQALVLVPEIGLTPQLVQRFAERFEAPLVVLHSSLSEGERLTAWRHARSGEAAIVIGTRSAIFTPLARPGVIIVDEEHDGSYKQQEGFRYSARDLAVMRARRQDLPIILGSATPSLESLHNARERRYIRYVLPERPGEARHPRMSLVDLRQHAAESGLAGPVLLAITRHLEAAGQVLVYLNRRGYAPTLFCPGCGWIAPCPQCDARLTVHLRSQRLRCHHCGADQAMPLGCPTCGHEIKPVGQGTERVEDLLRDRFPRVPLVRLDRDSVRRKGEMQAALERVTTGEARILVGTQMLAKGHHFPDVTLVVIVNADQGLFSADFRASERLAQTIVQVAGRAGRASRPGEVLIQTEFPRHPLLVSLLEQGYEGFAAAALEERAAAHWPPFSRLALLRADAREVAPTLRFLEAAARAAQPVPKGVRILGPVLASMARRAGRHHAQLLIESDARTVLQRFLTDWMPAVEELRGTHRVHWSLDVDPQELM